MDPEFRLFVVFAQPVQQLIRSRRARRTGQAGQPAFVARKHLGTGVGPIGTGRQAGAPEFMPLVKHHLRGSTPFAAMQHTASNGAGCDEGRGLVWKLQCGGMWHQQR